MTVHRLPVLSSLIMNVLLHCALSLVAQCIVIGPVYVCICLCVCGFVCLWVCYHDNSKLCASILHQTGSVGEGSDHLQLIKFWPSCAPVKGVCSGVKIFGSTLLQPAHSVCISMIAFYILSALRLAQMKCSLRFL